MSKRKIVNTECFRGWKFRGPYGTSAVKKGGNWSCPVKTVKQHVQGPTLAKSFGSFCWRIKIWILSWKRKSGNSPFSYREPFFSGPERRGGRLGLCRQANGLQGRQKQRKKNGPVAPIDRYRWPWRSISLFALLPLALFHLTIECITAASLLPEPIHFFQNRKKKTSPPEPRCVIAKK
jgi:hypothetical protein